MLDPGVMKGAGGDISGKHPPAYYDEIDTSGRDGEDAEEN